MESPELYYVVYGDKGPYLLLVHGVLSSRAQCRDAGRSLPDCVINRVDSYPNNK